MAELKESKKETQEESKPTSRGNKALVFVSHDTRDAELAEAFSKLLSSVSAGVLKSFRSSDKRGNQGIAYGVEWYPEIMKKLNDASDVVVLLTKNSVDRPWILYEAGVARGKLDTPLLGVAIGIPLNKANNGPFAQFQNSGDDIDSLTKLVIQLVNRIPNAEPDKGVIKMQVEAFKKQAEEITSKEPETENNDGELMEDSSVAKLFEEVKIMFQDLPERIDRNTDPRRKRRRFPFHPKIMHEVMYMSEKSGDRYLGFLIVISFFKEDMPWVYEIGKETYETLKRAKTGASKDNAISSFRRMIKHSLHHPMFVDMMDSKDSYRMLEELMYFSEEILSRISNEKK
ncbi:MAG: toll/interleukin-1 receptor domain-containing protein [Flavobacteriales bacterium]|nr:toll/interleukin-1 receptor domain-containing protein [Flavobacteriales bacterium]